MNLGCVKMCLSSIKGRSCEPLDRVRIQEEKYTSAVL